MRAENAVAAFRNGVLEIEMPTIPVPEVKKRTVPNHRLTAQPHDDS